MHFKTHKTLKLKINGQGNLIKMIVSCDCSISIGPLRVRCRPQIALVGNMHTIFQVGLVNMDGFHFGQSVLGWANINPD